MKRTVIVGLALGALSLTGCQYVAVGDSVLWQAAKQTKTDLLPDDSIIDASPGRGPDNAAIDGSPSLRQEIINDISLVDAGGTLIVQEAGDHAVTPQFVAWVVNYVPDDIRLAWVTPHNVWDKPMNDASIAAITEGLAARPGSVVIPWDQVDTQDLSTDGLHLNAAGIQVYAQTIAEGVR